MRRFVTSLRVCVECAKTSGMINHPADIDYLEGGYQEYCENCGKLTDLLFTFRIAQPESYRVGLTTQMGPDYKDLNVFDLKDNVVATVRVYHYPSWAEVERFGIKHLYDVDDPNTYYEKYSGKNWKIYRLHGEPINDEMLNCVAVFMSHDLEKGE